MKKLIFVALASISTALAAPPSRFKDVVVAGAIKAGSTVGTVADSKSVLELSSTTKGFLPPRMTTAQRDAISSPPTGLILFNTTTNAINQFSSGAWSAVGGGALSVTKISSSLAGGTRVTSTPDALGEYRTYKKDAGATSGTDEAPGATPSSANGMRIYAVDYASAGASGQTNRWEIFVGADKNLIIEFYKDASKGGHIDTDIDQVSATILYGVMKTYDPTSGLVIIDAQISPLGTDTTHYVGATVPLAGGANGAVTDAYFDITVF